MRREKKTAEAYLESEFQEALRLEQLSHALLKKAGMTLPQLHALHLILPMPSATLGKFTHRSGLSKGSASVLVSRLIEKGWLVSEQSAFDRRKKHLCLTLEGKGAYDRGMQIFRGLTRADRA